MATAVVSPGAESTHPADVGSIESEIGSLLSEGLPPTEDAPGGEGATPVPSQSTTEDLPGGEGPTSEGAQSDEKPGEYQLSEDGNHYLLPKAELQSYNGVKQYADQVQQWFPSTGDAQIAHQRSSDLQAMEADFYSGDPNRIEAVLNHWAGMNAQDPAMRDMSRQNFAQLATRAPEILKRIDPAAYQNFTSTMVKSQIDAAYAKAAQTGDPNDLHRAQFLDWGANGEYKKEAPAKPDPAAQQQKVEQTRQSDLDKRESFLLKRDFDGFNQTQLDGPKWTQFHSEIDKALAPVKEKYAPQVYDGIRMKIEKDLIQKLQADPDWASLHANERAMIEQSFSRAWKQGQSPATLKDRVSRYQNDFMVRVRRALPSIAAPVLTGATAKAVAPKPAAQPSAQARPRQASQQAPAVANVGPYSLQEDPEFQKLFR